MDIIELLFAVIPFIVGLIGISLIPSKDKILKDQIKLYKVEKQIVVYMIGFFILILGTYFFISSIFGESIEDQRMIYFINGLFLGIIGIGILGVNHRNFNLLTEKSIGADERVEATEVTELAEVEPIEPVELAENVEAIEHARTIDKKKATQKPVTTKEEQRVECPKCGHIIKVITSKRPVKISCPNCGIEGMIQ